jgi:4-hydroxyphenylacetate 3-monooxygenase
MFGRTPDYKNASVIAFAHAPGFLAQGSNGQTDFVQNTTQFYDEAQLNDRVLTHTLVNPSFSHAQA